MRGLDSKAPPAVLEAMGEARGRARTHGFTLIELVITIAVGSVVVAFMSLFIVMPMNAYTAQTRRATLVDESDSALRFISRDLRSALPNSVRTAASGSVTALELLATADGARYQDNGPVSNPALALDFTAPDGAFATTVPFTQLTLPWTSNAYYLSIYNVGVPGADAYQMANVITPTGTTIKIAAGATANQNLVILNPPFQFAYGSPEKRVYLVSGPVSYLCDTTAGTLTRYTGYAIQSIEPTSAAALNAAGAASGLIA
jgi:MSHA biogenesis protein MshO